MSSDGERIEELVLIARVLMRSGRSIDEAISDAGSLIPLADHAAVRHALVAQASTTITVVEPGVLAEGGPRAWFANHNPAEGYYWRRQRDFLAYTLDRKAFEIDSLDKATNRILAHLEDPNASEGFAIRGLVIGHVQSGKTQNFSALIAKAADAGYKIVIVLSGLHNSLRRQTQLRLERDLGREHVEGVGEPEAGKRWQWMTGSGLRDDFAKGGFNAAVLQGNEQVILVVKKNKTRLEWLNAWMKDRVPPDVAVLVIDDEADQASINTGGNRGGVSADLDPENDLDLEGGGRDFDTDSMSQDEVSPTAINKNVRLLINRFNKTAYIAYTATPFANVLINPDSYDFEAGKDLYPRHFIINLPDPPGDQYVGSTRLFGRDAITGEAGNSNEDGLDVIEFVSDSDIAMLLPPKGQKAAPFAPIVPPALRQALTDYVLAAGALMQRLGEGQPCTMLIHTDMRRRIQNLLEPEIERELATIRQNWLYDAENYRPELEKRWNEAFVPVTASIDISRSATFDQIEPFIERLLRDGIVVRVLNSDHDDELDFDSEPSLKAILIGGNKLSRGLTIEGLLVSFYVRSTLYYDTLLQMARWFGYRGRYVDLTRLYSTRELVSYFHDLATAEADLRSQVARYERDRLTPTDFVVRVRKHAVMKVTQPNKMQDAEASNLSYSGELVQTLRVPEALANGRLPEVGASALRDNLEAARALFSELGEPDDNRQAKPIWTAVAPATILRFLLAFSVRDERKFDAASLVDYIEAQNKVGELTRWRVLLACGSKMSDRPQWSEDLSVAGRERVPLLSRTRTKQDPTSMGVVTDPSDELTGLSDDQIAAAERGYTTFPDMTKARHQREQRDPAEGLLMIYPISPASEPDSRGKNRTRLFEQPINVPTVIQYALAFPFSRSDAAVEYLSAPTSGGRL